MDISGIPASLYRRIGDVIYISGHVGIDENGGTGANFEEHAQIVLDNMAHTLSLEGATLADVVTTQCFISDFANFDTFNKVYARNFGDNKPGRTTVQAGFGSPDLLLEINGIAYLNQ